MAIAPGTRLGRYEIKSQLGAGGMGEVYLAEDTQLRRRVAVKVLPAGSERSEESLRRFEQEAYAASSLNHPNILTIHEIGEAGPTRYIVTEFVEGVSLRDHMRNGPLKLAEALDVAAQIAGALAAAHEAGVVHRDVKPENVMIRRDRLAKVLDFGLAKLAPGQTSDVDTEAATRALVDTTAGVVMGTASYMSPEQAGGLSVDARTDVWSLGVVLYEMLTGRLPFEGRDIHRQIIAIQEQEPPPLSRYGEAVPERLEEIVAKALAKDPDERYQTAKDLLIDLRNLKRRLDAGAEIERSVPPELGAGAGGELTYRPRSTARSRPAAHRTTAERAHPTSSAEYLVGEIKRHPRGAALVLAALALACASVGYYFFAPRGEQALDSVAVLPFVNPANDPETEYLSEGVTESVINSLSQLPQLRVMARSTVFRFKGRENDPQGVGRELGVRAVMVGRLLQQGENLAVGVELVNVSDGSRLWGEQYNRRASDLAAVQHEIARDISERLRLRLSGEERRQLTRGGTNNTEAYHLYLRGRYYWNRRSADGLRRAIELFQQAIERDPEYAFAYVGLADCYNVLEYYAGTPASETLPRARAAADRALKIEDSLAEAHTSLAYYHHQSWQWDEAEREFKRAIGLNPNYPTAHHWYQVNLRARGRLDEALREIKRAQELDPLSPVLGLNHATVYTRKGDLDSAMGEAKRLVELDPNFPLAHEPLGKVYVKQGRHEEAIEAFRRDVAADRTAYSLANLGHAYAAAGRREEALALLGELEEKYARREALGQYVALVHVGLGDLDQAFGWLEKDFRARSGSLDFIVTNPLFDPVRGDGRYADLLRRMGLEQ